MPKATLKETPSSFLMRPRLREKKKRATPAERRIKLRDSIWSDADTVIWKKSAGWLLIPRTLPLVMHLIKVLTPKGDASRAYFDLWCRSSDDRLITITDDGACAYASGYTGTRAERTWREHMWSLHALGFIRIAKDGNHDIGHVLLLDPIQVCSNLKKKNKVPPEWWNALLRRLTEIGAEMPE